MGEWSWIGEQNKQIDEKHFAVHAIYCPTLLIILPWTQKKGAQSLESSVSPVGHYYGPTWVCLQLDIVKRLRLLYGEQLYCSVHVRCFSYPRIDSKLIQFSHDISCKLPNKLISLNVLTCTRRSNSNTYNIHRHSNSKIPPIRTKLSVRNHFIRSRFISWGNKEKNIKGTLWIQCRSQEQDKSSDIEQQPPFGDCK